MPSMLLLDLLFALFIVVIVIFSEAETFLYIFAWNKVGCSIGVLVNFCQFELVLHFLS